MKYALRWGKRNIDAEGFIHCSTIEYFWRVAPNFADVEEDYVNNYFGTTNLQVLTFADGSKWVPLVI